MNVPITNMALRVHQSLQPKNLKGAATMYRLAREILTVGITFSAEQRLAEAQLRLDALHAARKAQAEAATKNLPTLNAIRKKEAYIFSLYAKEIAEVEEALKQAQEEIDKKS